MKPKFKTGSTVLQSTYLKALEGLEKNTWTLFGFPEPVLVEGGLYKGIWLECGPLEAAVYGAYRPEVAVSSHRIFFRWQREDGYIPCTIRQNHILTGQIQMVVPIAATALEIAALSQKEEFLQEAYEACSKWDNWLAKYRDTRKTGLCELFCEWDTGHDNSPRLKGLPHDCPGQDARVCPKIDSLPYLAPDLSATVYGGRKALAKMARLLGKNDQEEFWEEKAETIRRAILAYCFEQEDLCFYDVDKSRKFLRIKGDVLTRVFGEHVVEQSLFDRIFEKHILNPQEFWTPYPLPSIAINDPAFVHELPQNSWGGASQALTALRAPRWFEYYGKPAELTHLMKRWVEAITASSAFMQQMNPWTGEFSTSQGYSPAMCVILDFVSRLYGIRIEEQMLEWNCRLPEGSNSCRYTLQTPGGTAELSNTCGITSLNLAGKQKLQVKGECRIITDCEGTVKEIAGTCPQPVIVEISSPEGMKAVISINPNQKSEVTLTYWR